MWVKTMLLKQQTANCKPAPNVCALLAAPYMGPYVCRRAKFSISLTLVRYMLHTVTCGSSTRVEMRGRTKGCAICVGALGALPAPHL